MKIDLNDVSSKNTKQLIHANQIDINDSPVKLCDNFKSDNKLVLNESAKVSAVNESAKVSVVNESSKVSAVNESAKVSVVSELDKVFDVNELNKVSILSGELINSNKEILIIETFFYDIINIIFDGI